MMFASKRSGPITGMLPSSGILMSSRIGGLLSVSACGCMKAS